MNIRIVPYYLFVRHVVPIAIRMFQHLITSGNQRITKQALKQVQGEVCLILINGQLVSI